MLFFRHYRTYYRIYLYICEHMLLIMCQYGRKDKQNKGHVG